MGRIAPPEHNPLLPGTAARSIALDITLFLWHWETWLPFLLDIFFPTTIPTPALCSSFSHCLRASWFLPVPKMVNSSKKASSDGISCPSSNRRHQKLCEKTISHGPSRLISWALMAWVGLETVHVSIYVLECLSKLLIRWGLGISFRFHKNFDSLLCFFWPNAFCKEGYFHLLISAGCARCFELL